MWGGSVVSKEVTVSSGWSEMSPAEGMKGWKSVLCNPGRGNCQLPGGPIPSPDGRPSLPT